MKYTSRLLLCALSSGLAVPSLAQFSFTTFDDGILIRDPAVYNQQGYATGISADGTRIAGRRAIWWPSGHPKSGPETEAVVFTLSGGAWSMTLLGDAADVGSPNNSSSAIGISGDGLRPFGQVQGQIDGSDRYWPSLFSPITIFNKVGGVYNVPIVTAVNYDGSIVVGKGSGTYTTDPYAGNQNFWHKWVNNSIQTITPFGTGGEPVAISWDGTIFAGYTHSILNDGYWSGFRYRDGFGFEYLPKPADMEHMFPKAISGNGLVIVGDGDTWEQQFADRYPVIFTEAGGTRWIPGPPGKPRGAFVAANQDGSVLVGFCKNDPFDAYTPLLWTSHSGPVDLEQYLIQNGVDLANYDMRGATGVSADGQTITGDGYRIHPVTGRNEAVPWVVHIDLPQGLVNFSTSLATAVGGAPLQSSISLYKTATEDETVVFTSSNPDVLPIPASVTVPAGGKNLTFNLASTGVSAETTVTLTATYGNLTKTLNVTLLPATLKSVKIGYLGTPTPLDAGKSAVGTLTLTGKAPVGGTSVLVWDNTRFFDLPTGAAIAMPIVVPEGETFVKFTIKTLPSDAELTRVVSAKHGSSTQTANLSLKPWYAVKALTVLPYSLQSGAAATGKVTINLPARTGGESVSILAGAGLTVPVSVLVPAGQSSVQFAVTADAVSSGRNTYVKAILGGVSKQANVSIKRPVLVSITMPASFTGGSTVTCTVSLSGKAASDLSITLKDSTTALNSPSSVIIPAGASSVTFQITSNAVTATQVGKTLLANYSGLTKKATFTINP